MEVLPAPQPKKPKPRKGEIITVLPGEPGDVETHKYQTMADAMRRAMQTVRSVDEIEDPDPDPYGYAQDLENEYGLNLLDPQWKSRPDDPRWVRRSKARARKAAVAKLYLQGNTVRIIAQKVKCAEITVLRDINAIQQEWRKSYIDDIEILASRDLARLDDMFLHLAKGIEEGDVKSIMAGIKIIEERGNILGYRHGVQVDIEQHIREIAEARGFDPEVAVTVAQRISVKYKM